jgi:hypothetical protein
LIVIVKTLFSSEVSSVWYISKIFPKVVIKEKPSRLRRDGNLNRPLF